MAEGRYPPRFWASPDVPLWVWFCRRRRPQELLAVTEPALLFGRDSPPRIGLLEPLSGRKGLGLFSSLVCRPPYLAEGTPLAGGQGRAAPGRMSLTGAAGTGGEHPSLVSHILRLSQTKINVLRLPGTFTAILTSTKDQSSMLTPSPSSQRWQQLRLLGGSDRLSSAGRKL